MPIGGAKLPQNKINLIQNGKMMALKIKCFTFLILLVITKSLSQNKYITREGIIEFESQIKAFEPIKAKQNSVTSVFNADTGEMPF